MIVRSNPYGPASTFPAVASSMGDASRITRCNVTAILVMYGLPRLLTGAILAHEMMHAYLRMANVHHLDLMVEEGLCQLMAMLFLDAQDAWSKAQPGGFQSRLHSYFAYQIRNDPTIVYGDGFRAAFQSFQTHGLSKVVQHVIRHGSFPP